MAEDIRKLFPSLWVTSDMQKIDPIGKKYFGPLTQANLATDIAFYLAAALSVLVVLMPKDDFPVAYQNVQAIFLITTIAGFVVGLASRLYWAPRAQSNRLDDFLSKGLGVSLTYESTQGYYNNDETESFRRIGMQIMENSFFSQEVTREMCRTERLMIGIYVLVWVFILTNRGTSIDLVVAISLVLFSEQLIARIFRLEWLRIQCENTHSAIYRLFQSDDRGKVFQANVLCHLVRYENAKANASVMTSTKIFDKQNERLTGEWNAIKKTISPK